MTIKKRIMLIEDDPTMRSLLTTLLQLEKHEVVVGNEFQMDSILSMVAEKTPDIIILDYRLKSINGLEVLQNIRLTPAGQKSRIIMVSGFDMREVCLDAGADGFLQKPYMPSELLAWIGKEN